MWLHSPTPEDTGEAGAALGRAIAAGGGGAVVGLSGPLGAGKTRFVKGLAEALGVDPGRVSSPTFVIANEYPLGRGAVLAHVDLYRLSDEAELLGTGFLDWLAAGNVVAVEWADRLPEALPADRLELRFALAGDSQRRLNAIASGPGATALLERWRAELVRATSRSGLRVESGTSAHP